MKITIAHLLNEMQEADIAKRAICSALGKVKVKKSDLHPPYKHIYITTEKKKDAPCNNRE